MTALRNAQEDYDPRQRFRIFRLCDCPTCGGSGKELREATDLRGNNPKLLPWRCSDCRGEGRIRQEVAACESPEALGVAIVMLAREGEFEECPVGILDSEGAVGKKWLVRPWLPSARNVSDAGRTLARKRHASG